MTATRTKGHTLKRLAWDEERKGFAWTCECGHDLGVLAVHPARAAWREHKAALTDTAQSGNGSAG